jgi:hypothetical protein
MNRRQAFTLMLEAHASQTDKLGEPYIFHLLAVEEQVAALGEDFSVCALLHDTFEDTELEVSDFLEVPASVNPRPELTRAQATSLIAITHIPGEPNDDYVRRVRGDFIASVVKWADFNHNLSPDRQAGLDPETAKRLAAKYERGRAILLGRE